MSQSFKSGIWMAFFLLICAACSAGKAASTSPLGQPMPAPPTTLVASSPFGVIGLDAISGALLWQAPRSTFFGGTILQHDARAFYLGTNYSTASTEVFALDAHTGQTLWHTVFAGIFPQGFALNDSTVFAANQKSLLALKMSDGSILWQMPLDEVHQVNRLLADDNRLYVASFDHLAAFDIAHGVLRWQDRGVFDASLLTQNVILANVACNGMIILPILSNTYGICTVAINATDGKTLWGKQVAGGKCVFVLACTGSQGSPPGSNGNVAYVISNEKTPLPKTGTPTTSGMSTPTTSVHQDLIALNLVSGKEWWRIDLPGSDGISTDTLPTFTVLGANESAVFIGSSNGAVIAFDLVQHSQIWQINPQLRSDFTFPIYQGIAYFLGINQVIAINPASGTMLWTHTYSPG